MEMEMEMEVMEMGVTRKVGREEQVLKFSSVNIKKLFLIY